MESTTPPVSVTFTRPSSKSKAKQGTSAADLPAGLRAERSTPRNSAAFRRAVSESTGVKEASSAAEVSRDE